MNLILCTTENVYSLNTTPYKCKEIMSTIRSTIPKRDDVITSINSYKYTFIFPLTLYQESEQKTDLPGLRWSQSQNLARHIRTQSNILYFLSRIVSILEWVLINLQI